MIRQAPPLRRTAAPVRVVAVRDGGRQERPDRVAAEEPMEVRVAGPGAAPQSVAVIMRTPGHDFELAAGFLFTEGVIGGREDVGGIDYCRLPAEEQRYNVVTVTLTRSFDPEAVRRNVYASSSCGVCGKASLDSLRVRCPAIGPGPVVAVSTIVELPGALRRTQRIFDQTGGLHAAGLFDAEGSLRSVREDVGRHNAVDKLVGQALLEERQPLADHVLLVSGRVGFEIVQKAAMAAIPIVCAVSAPSSLAVETAAELGMTVVGFVRGGGFNVYTGTERIGMGP